MIEKYLIAILGITGMMLAWIGIQHLWRKTFSEHVRDMDVLARRSTCGSCGCTTPCETKKKIEKH